MSISMGALAADQAEVENTANNIANSNTPGYARRRLVLEELPPTPGNSVGSGVEVASVQSLRDPMLDLRIQQETQQQSASQTVADSMQPLQTLFTPGNGGVSDSLSAFFSSLQQLSTSPTDLSLRSTVLASANTLAASFRNTASQLTGAQASLDQGVTQSVSQINQLTAQLAAVNSQVSQSPGQASNDLQDQQQEILSQLSNLVDVSVTQGSDGPTITTGNGTALVVGGQSFALTTAVNPTTGFQDVISAQGEDITSQIQAGQLGGQLQARDGQIAGLLSELNNLAASFASTMNKAHTSGFDLNGQPGGDLFTVTAGAEAETMAVAITQPSAVAASSIPPSSGDNAASTGDNGNVLAMIAAGQNPLSNSQTAAQLFSGMVSELGNDVSQAQSNASAGSLILQQLQDEQGSISGVSIDEEASNLITYQQAYQAAARVVSVVSQLSQTAINLGYDTSTSGS